MGERPSHSRDDDGMKLVLTNKMPPGGYRFSQPELSWTAPRDLALTGAAEVATALSVVRSQNPDSGLDASYAACYAAVVQATYDRFKGLPNVVRRYVQVVSEQQAVAVVVADDAPKPRVTPIKSSGGGCASCGARRARRAKT
jgi:hypothetical protein